MRRVKHILTVVVERHLVFNFLSSRNPQTTDVVQLQNELVILAFIFHSIDHRLKIFIICFKYTLLIHE